MDARQLSEKIWNRALGPAGAAEREGDKALRALLRFHGEAMSAGVLHALSYSSPEQLAAAQYGYRFYGFDAVAELIGTPIDEDADPDQLDERESELDDAYGAAIPLDGTIAHAVEAHLKACPEMYAPLS